MFNEKRKKVIRVAQSFLGCNEKNGSHKKIIDIYNQHKPLPRGYAVQYDDYWCATFVAAVAIIADCLDIIPMECSCAQMITLCKEKRIWQENDFYIPKMGDIVFYDWQDSGTGNCLGYPDHVGYVVEVVDDNILAIEGNINREVNYRTIRVDGINIRGYGLPRYEESSGYCENTPTQYIVKEGDTLYKIASLFQQSVDSLAAHNGITNPNKIYAGDIIHIPNTIKIYVVESGDCLSVIAEKFDTSVSKLMLDNNITDPDVICAGQKLKIY